MIRPSLLQRQLHVFLSSMSSFLSGVSRGWGCEEGRLARSRWRFLHAKYGLRLCLAIQPVLYHCLVLPTNSPGKKKPVSPQLHVQFRNSLSFFALLISPNPFLHFRGAVSLLEDRKNPWVMDYSRCFSSYKILMSENMSSFQFLTKDFMVLL